MESYIGTANGNKTSNSSNRLAASSGMKFQRKIEKRKASASTLTTEHAAVSSVMYPQRHSSIGTLHGKQSFIRPIAHSTKRNSLNEATSPMSQMKPSYVLQLTMIFLQTTTTTMNLMRKNPRNSLDLNPRNSFRLLNARILPSSTTKLLLKSPRQVPSFQLCSALSQIQLPSPSPTP